MLNDYISTQFRNLYEDRASDVLPDDVFKRLMSGYLEEYGKLESELAMLQSAQKETTDVEQRVSEWVRDIRESLEVKELDRSVLFGLIDKIIVSERSKGADGKDEQRIKIIYRFTREKAGRVTGL